MHIRLVLSASGLLLSACATSYQPTAMTGGFSETELAPDVVRVIFRGDGYAAKEPSLDFALLHAAELSLQAGFSYFAVLNEENATRVFTTTTPATATTSGSAQTVGNQTIYSLFDPGRTIRSYKPETGLLVQFLRQKPEGKFVFDASFIVSSIMVNY